MNLKKLICNIESTMQEYRSFFECYYENVENQESDSSETFISMQEELKERISLSTEALDKMFLLLFDAAKAKRIFEKYKKVIDSRPYSIQEAIKPLTFVLIEDGFGSLLWSDFYSFLQPFLILTTKKENGQLLNVLGNILEETVALCKQAGVKPMSEPAVYKTVKQYITIVFPKSKDIRGQSFPNVSKVYKPDIVVPECRAAIEYKYIDNKEKVNSTIDQIASDVKGYHGHSGVDRFYAVFYFKEAYVSANKFKQIWKEKEFPSNWNMVYCVETK